MIAHALLGAAVMASALVTPAVVSAPAGAATISQVAEAPGKAAHPCRLHNNPERCSALGHIRIRIRNRNNNIAVSRDDDGLVNRIRIHIRNENTNTAIPRDRKNGRHDAGGRDDWQPPDDSEEIRIHNRNVNPH